MANLKRYFPVVKTSSSLKQKDTKKSASRYDPYKAPEPRDRKRSVTSRSPPQADSPNYVYRPIFPQALERCAQQVFGINFEG